jgi:hypothetical protein
MSIKFINIFQSKALKNLPQFVIFGFENKPSGNPGGKGLPKGFLPDPLLASKYFHNLKMRFLSLKSMLRSIQNIVISVSMQATGYIHVQTCRVARFFFVGTTYKNGEK